MRFFSFFISLRARYRWNMVIEKKLGILSWGELDVSLCGAVNDWNGEALKNPIGYSFVIDEQSLWFIATHREAAQLHPDSSPGVFMPDLWKYDVAEFFLTNPENGHYLEVNLAPNAAWWAAEFSGPREGMKEVKLEGINTYADMHKDGGWIAAMRLDVAMLRDEFGFCQESLINAAFIIGSPEQKFVSVAELGEGKPDFHQPTKFRAMQIIDEAALKQLSGR